MLSLIIYPLFHLQRNLKFHQLLQPPALTWWVGTWSVSQEWPPSLLLARRSVSGVTWTPLEEDGQSCKGGETLGKKRISSWGTGPSTRLGLVIQQRYVYVSSSYVSMEILEIERKLLNYQICNSRIIGLVYPIGTTLLLPR